MMNGMMGKMGPMSQMGCGPEMMKKGIEKKEKMMSGGFNPQEMCHQMTSAVTQAAELGSYATPEVRALFNDWVGEVEKEIIAFVKANKQVSPATIAEQLRISEESAIFFISRLAEHKKVKITSIEFCEPVTDLEKQKTPEENHTYSPDKKEGEG